MRPDSRFIHARIEENVILLWKGRTWERRPGVFGDEDYKVLGTVKRETRTAAPCVDRKLFGGDSEQ